MSNRTRRRALGPLAYLGVEASTPPQFVIENRSPTSNDKYIYNLGTYWMVGRGTELWILVDLLSASGATWIQIYPATASSSSSFVTDSGTATTDMGEVNVYGDTVITTSASINTVSHDLSGGIDGQVLVGATGAIPQWANITSVSGTITVTNAANAINLEAVPEGSINYIADGPTSTTPSGGAMGVTGGTNISTSGAGQTVTISLDAAVTIANSLTVSTYSEGVVQSTSGGLFSSSNGTDGQLLISSSSGAPAWANITSNDSSVTITNSSNGIDMAAMAATGNRYAFLGVLDTSVVGQLGADSFYTIGDGTALTEIYDEGSAFDVGGASAATFTAPATGKYLLVQTFQYQLTSTSGSPSQYPHNTTIETVSSNRTYRQQFTDVLWSGYTSGSNLDSENRQPYFSVVADLDLGDTVTWQIKVFMKYPVSLTLFGNPPFVWTSVAGCLIA